MNLSQVVVWICLVYSLQGQNFYQNDARQVKMCAFNMTKHKADVNWLSEGILEFKKIIGSNKIFIESWNSNDFTKYTEETESKYKRIF